MKILSILIVFLFVWGCQKEEVKANKNKKLISTVQVVEDFKGDLVIYPKSDSTDNRFTDLIELLEMALEKTKEEFGPYKLRPSKSKMTEPRIKISVKEGSNKVNILWNTPTKENIKHFLPVNFPPRKGILGYRIFIINKKDQDKFSNIKTLEELKKLEVLQGLGWGDVAVFKANNFKVKVGSNYEGLFKMMDLGRVDYFSRGITEAFVEVNNRMDKLKNLKVEESILLYYDWPYYFLLNKKNTRLKKRLERGFDLAVKDGSRDKHFNKWYKKYIDQARLKERKIFRIKNPLIWEGINLEKKEYWYKPF